MESTQEFPHVALSPGQSPGVASPAQDQPKSPKSEEQEEKGEASDESSSKTTALGTPVNETTNELSVEPGTEGPEAVRESCEEEALPGEQAAMQEAGVAIAVENKEGLTSLEEDIGVSEPKQEDYTAPDNQEALVPAQNTVVEEHKEEDSRKESIPSSVEHEVDKIFSPQEQVEETAQCDKVGDTLDRDEEYISVDEAGHEEDKMDTTDGDLKPDENVQVASTGHPEVDDAGAETTKGTSGTQGNVTGVGHENPTITGGSAVEENVEEKGRDEEVLVTSKEDLESQEKHCTVENSKESNPLQGNIENVVAELISQDLISESSQEIKPDEPLPEENNSSCEKTVVNADVHVETTDAIAVSEEKAENDSKHQGEEEPELMDTQIIESEDGNTQDSIGDLVTKDSREDSSNMDKVPKIFDECSMESFVSAKSSEFDYRDSIQGSPLPVKRVRELIYESPRASPKRSRTSTPTIQNEDDLGIFPAENVFEYQWPQDNPGEWYFVQEQISEFLGVKSFKRKYPHLERRVMCIKEKEFLRERGVVTEEQVTLGLTALRGDEVYDLMMKDYPARYSEYARVIQEKQRQNISNQHKGYEAPTMDASKIKAYIKKAAKKAAEFNAMLMREKREERQYYFDLQTMQLHMPQSKMKKLSKEDTKIGAYPVAVIPGQYQDYCRHYTSDELNYLPLNTALYGPMAIRRKTDYGPVVDEEEVEDDLDIIAELTKIEDVEKKKSMPSTQPPKNDQQQQQQQREQQEQRLQQLLSQPVQPHPTPQKPTPQRQQARQQQPPQDPPQQHPLPGSSPARTRSPASAPTILRPRAGPIMVQPGPESGGSGDSDMVRLPGPEALQQSMEAVVPTPPRPYQPKIKPTAICGLCLKDRRSNTKGVPENLVHCSQCDNSGHPSCLDMNDELVATIKTYPWQCMECKTCSQCGDPTHEDKMMFCDKCDRGYHTFCVGLTDIPTGNWLCPTCSAGGLPPPVPPPPPSNFSLGILPMPGVTPLPQQVPQGPLLQPSQTPQQVIPLQQGAPPLPPQQPGMPPQPTQPTPQEGQLQQQGVPAQQQSLPPQEIPQPTETLPATPQEPALGNKRKNSKR